MEQLQRKREQRYKSTKSLRSRSRCAGLPTWGNFPEIHKRNRLTIVWYQSTPYGEKLLSPKLIFAFIRLALVIRSLVLNMKLAFLVI